jgi:tRNA-dihydrouridine synthase
VLEYYGPERGSRLLRKFVAWGLKGFKGAPRLREMVNTLSGPEQVDVVLDEALRTDPGLLAAAAEEEPMAESCEAVA